MHAFVGRPLNDFRYLVFEKNMVTSPTRSLYESPRGYYRQFFHSSQQFLITYFRPCWLKEVHKKVQRWLLWDIKVKPFDQRLTNSKNNQSRSRHDHFFVKAYNKEWIYKFWLFTNVIHDLDWLDPLFMSLLEPGYPGSDMKRMMFTECEWKFLLNKVNWKRCW